MTGSVTDDALPATIAWADDHIRLIDQRRLPAELVVLEVGDVGQLCELIATLAVRGAPALGAAGAMGVALATVRGDDPVAAAARLRATRPTAVNLGWGIDRALAAADPVAEAVAIAAADVDRNRRLGAHGAALVAGAVNVLTHCNAGGLACVGYGTAVGVVRSAHEQGQRLHVWVDETRPLWQGSRLTAWELGQLGIPCTVVVDSLAATLMAEGRVDAVIVGADRVAANGDTANKVGTYALAVAAHHHGVPFYVAAPLPSVDPATPDGAAIRIEHRDRAEVAVVGDLVLAPPATEVENRAFDVTPAALISAWVSEAGVSRRAEELLERRRGLGDRP